MDIHPHKTANGDNGFCWGNIGGQVVNAISGEHPDLAGSETLRGVHRNVNLDIITKAALQGVKDPDLEIAVLGEYEKYFRIYDLNKYLSLVHQILFFADYDNPYIHLEYDYLNDRVKESLDDMTCDAKYDAYDEEEFEADRIADVSNAICQNYVSSDYINSIKELYKNCEIDMSEVKNNMAEFSDYIPNVEYKVYKSAVEETKETTPVFISGADKEIIEKLDTKLVTV